MAHLRSSWPPMDTMDVYEQNRMLLQQVAYLESTRDHLTQQLQAATTELLPERIQVLERDLAWTRQTMDSLAIKTRRQHEAELSSIHAEYTRQINEDKLQLAILVKKFTGMEDICHNVKIERDQLKEDVAKQQEDLNILSSQYSETIDELRQCKDDFKAAVNEHRNIVAALKEDLANAQERHRKSALSIDQLQAKLHRRERELDSVTTEFENLRKDYHGLEQQHAALQQSHSQLQQTNDLFHQDRDVLRARTIEQQSQLEKNAKTIEALQRQLAQERNSHLNATQAAKAEYQKENTELQRHLALVLRELEQFKATATQRESATLEQSQGALDRFKTAASEEYSSLIQRLQESGRQRESIEAQLSKAQQELAESRALLQSETEKNEKCNQELQAARTANAQLQQQLERMFHGLQKRKLELEDAHAQNQQLQKVVQQLQQEKDQVADEKDRLADEKDQLGDALQTMRKQLVLQLRHVQQLLAKEEQLMMKNSQLVSEIERIQLTSRKKSINDDIDDEEDERDLDVNDGDVIDDDDDNALTQNGHDPKEDI